MNRVFTLAFECLSYMNEYSLSKSKRAGRGSRKPKSMDPERQLLIDVFRDTQTRTQKLPSVESQVFSIDALEEQHFPCTDFSHVSIVEMDTLDLVLSIPVPALVLNMASDVCPGGGVASGKRAQEECIFRRTNAIHSYQKEWYPLRNDCVYSPEITIIKTSTYEMLQDFRTCSMIAMPGLRKPKLTPDGKSYARDYDRDAMSIRIDAIFQLAIEKGHYTLVLGALGCGAFGNPPEEVAELFKRAISQYGGYFAHIYFAILSTEDSRNLDVFRKVIQG